MKGRDLALALVAVAMWLVWAACELIASRRATRSRRETVPYPYCLHPTDCQADDDGYCADCHARLYP